MFHRCIGLLSGSSRLPELGAKIWPKVLAWGQRIWGVTVGVSKRGRGAEPCPVGGLGDEFCQKPKHFVV